MEQKISDMIMVEVDKVLLQYKEGAILASEGIYKIISLYGEKQEQVDLEHNEMLKKLDELK